VRKTAFGQHLSRILFLTSITACASFSLSLQTTEAKSTSQKGAASAKAPVLNSDDLLKAAVDAGNKAYAQQNYDLAEKSFRSALSITQKNEGVLALLNRAMIYSNLGTVYFAQKKLPEAEVEYNHAIDLQEKLLASHHAVVADTLHHYSALLRKMNKADEADRVETQAEVLKVSSLSGKDADFKFDHGEPLQSKAEPTAIPTFIGTSAKAPESNSAPTFSINRIIKMSSQDLSILNNPTTTQQPVYREETYWEGGGIDPISGIIVGATQKTRQVLDHYENVKISSPNDLSYVSAVADLERRYSLSQSKVRELLDAINSGGAAVELANGWLLVTNEDLNPNHWFNGMKVSTAIRPTETATYVLKTADDKHQFVGKRVSVLNI
jgi:tetratricopeptide (TPR) repeat protein